MRRLVATTLALYAALCVVAGCKATCPIIDLANKACPTVVEYVDQYGARHTTVITNNDADEIASIKAARSSRRDAGAP